MPNTLFQIPAGATPSRCNGPSCTARIYRIFHPTTGRRHPVVVNPDIDVNCVAPTATKAGIGISHFADCPDAALFRSPQHTRRVTTR